ncbi:unnamed protein product [Linum trigynum]|uniref:Uncharacterized protein n=1 Tax=Linum trigynum TaxID=586398 RepID=A0AAV2DUV9_9ROSI
MGMRCDPKGEGSGRWGGIVEMGMATGEAVPERAKGRLEFVRKGEGNFWVVFMVATQEIRSDGDRGGGHGW